MVPARKYAPNGDKHKAPNGFGSLCPHPFDAASAQELLTGAIEVEGTRRKLWAAAGKWCFCAHQTRPEANEWHGFPVIGSEVPERVLRALLERGLIDRHELRRLRKQRALPGHWP